MLGPSALVLYAIGAMSAPSAPSGDHGLSVGRVIYVDDDAAPGGDGASWDTALRFVQDAIRTTRDDVEIRIGQGTYRPDEDAANPGGTGDDRAAFEVLARSVVLRGGYAGAGANDPDAWDPGVFVTALSGDLSEDGDEVSDDLIYVEDGDLAVIGLSLVDAEFGVVAQAETSRHRVVVDRCRVQQVEHGLNSTWAMLEVRDTVLIGCREAVSMFWGRLIMTRVDIFGCGFDGGDKPVVILHSNADIESCCFEQCTGRSAIDLDDALVNMRNCVFRDNVGDRAAGIFGIHAQLNLMDCLFEDNRGGKGGACYLAGGGVVYAERCSFRANSGKRYGAAIFCPQVTVLDCVFIDNRTSKHGGAVDVGRGLIQGCRFERNFSPLGAAIAAHTGEVPDLLWIEDTTICGSGLEPVFGKYSEVGLVVTEDCDG